jgi:ligand-binding sensor domain-containing protein
MNKKIISFFGVKSLIITSLSVLVFSGTGQENRNKTEGELLHVHADATQSSFFENNPPNEQICEVVRMMFQDSKGNIWFGAQGGAFRLSNNTLSKIDSIKSETGGRVTIHDITEGKDGKIWFGHTDGLSSYDGEIVKNYYESDGLLNNDVWNIESDTNGNIWIGTIEGLCKFNGDVFTTFELPEGIRDTTLGVSSTKMVHCIMEDSKGIIWFCTNAGLFRLKDNILHNASEEYGIRTNFINEIIESENGGYWISTKEALYKLVGNRLENITEQVTEVGKGIGSMSEDKNGKLYFVFNQHYLHIYDGKEIIEFEKTEDNKGPVVYQIYRDQNDRLWFLGFGGAYRLENGKFLNITKNGPW